MNLYIVTFKRGTPQDPTTSFYIVARTAAKAIEGAQMQMRKDWWGATYEILCIRKEFAINRVVVR